MVFSDDLPAAQRACSTTLIPLLPVTLMLVIWLLPSHARACGNAALCGDHIDAFFLPLIASSLTGAPAETGMPGWRVRVEHQLVA